VEPFARGDLHDHLALLADGDLARTGQRSVEGSRRRGRRRRFLGIARARAERQGRDRRDQSAQLPYLTEQP
jgi:hypothetical protein